MKIRKQLYKSFYFVLVVTLICFTIQVKAQRVKKNETVIFTENFNSYKEGELPSGWWVEGGQAVFVQNGHLLVKADPEKKHGSGYVATVWYHRQFSGDIRIQFDAHVVSSTIDANNINFFLFYSNPSESATMYSTRNLRLDGSYNHYKNLNGYIFTYLNASGDNTGKARFRMRRCPGFELIDENFAYQNSKGKTYHITVTKIGDELAFAVDGKVYLKKRDKKYNWEKGLIGFRTYQTILWFDNLKVVSLNIHD